GVDPQVQHQLGEPGGEQDVDEDVVELGEEPSDGAALPPFRQAVGPIFLKPGRGLGRIETLLGIGTESLDDLGWRQSMPGRHVLDRIRRHGCTRCAAKCSLRRQPCAALARSRSEAGAIFPGSAWRPTIRISSDCSPAFNMVWKGAWWTWQGEFVPWAPGEVSRHRLERGVAAGRVRAAAS